MLPRIFFLTRPSKAGWRWAIDYYTMCWERTRAGFISARDGTKAMDYYATVPKFANIQFWACPEELDSLLSSSRQEREMRDCKASAGDRLQKAPGPTALKRPSPLSALPVTSCGEGGKQQPPFPLFHTLCLTPKGLQHKPRVHTFKDLQYFTNCRLSEELLQSEKL